MPNIKAAQKWARQSEKRTTRNKDAKSRLKTLFKKAVEGAQATAKEVESAFDKAANKGVIHKNKAARKKSRLTKRLNTAGTSAPTKKAATKSRKKAPARKKS
jgi:small subunit ribosomal protein S20